MFGEALRLTDGATPDAARFTLNMARNELLVAREALAMAGTEGAAAAAAVAAAALGDAEAMLRRCVAARRAALPEGAPGAPGAPDGPADELLAAALEELAEALVLREGSLPEAAELLAEAAKVHRAGGGGDGNERGAEEERALARRDEVLALSEERTAV